MFKPIDSRPGHGTRRGICVVAINGIAFVAATLVLLQLPLSATLAIDRQGAPLITTEAGSIEKD